MWDEKRKVEKEKKKNVIQLLTDMNKYPELKNSRGHELFDLVNKML